MSSDEEIYSDDVGNDQDEDSCIEEDYEDYEGSGSGEGLSDESVIEDDESGLENDNEEFVVGSRYE